MNWTTAIGLHTLLEELNFSLHGKLFPSIQVVAKLIQQRLPRSHMGHRMKIILLKFPTHHIDISIFLHYQTALDPVKFLFEIQPCQSLMKGHCSHLTMKFEVQPNYFLKCGARLAGNCGMQQLVFPGYGFLCNKSIRRRYEYLGGVPKRNMNHFQEIFRRSLSIFWKHTWSHILLMEEILHHLGWLKAYK